MPEIRAFHIRTFPGCTLPCSQTISQAGSVRTASDQRRAAQARSASGKRAGASLNFADRTDSGAPEKRGNAAT
jgi:hypothetical protein